MLQSSLEKRKEALLSRRLALEQQVARLQEQLQECELRVTQESILESRGALPASAVIDGKGHQDDLDAVKSGNERHESSSSLNQVSNNSASAVSKLQQD